MSKIKDSNVAKPASLPLRTAKDDGKPRANSSATVEKPAPSLSKSSAQEEEDDVVIRLTDIHKTYQVGEVAVPVLKGVSLKIRRGEFVALMGASGQAKQL